MSFSQNAVNDLRTVVQAIGNEQPLILVGHSYGTLLVRLYAQRYTKNLKAIVLLDPANEYMPERIPGYAQLVTNVAEQFNRLIPVASLGLMALSTNSIPVNQLQSDAIAQYRAVLATGSFFEAAAKETSAMIDNLHAMQNSDKKMLANIPVVIVSRGQPEPMHGLPEASAQALEQTWSALQADLVDRLNAKQVIAEKSGHFVQLSQPELVFENIQPFIEDKN